MGAERTDQGRKTDGSAAERLAAGADAQGQAESPARQTAEEKSDSAGKRGRLMVARLVRMHGGLVKGG